MTLDPALSTGGLDGAEMWLSALKAAGRSPTTLAGYRHAVDKFAAWRGESDVTTLSKFEALRALFTWLVAEEFVSSRSSPKSYFDVLKNCSPDARWRIGSRFSTLPLNWAWRSSTCCLVGSNTQSRRHRTVSGRMTLPYSECL